MTYSDPDDDTRWVRANKGRVTGLLISGAVLGIGIATAIYNALGAMP